MSVCDGKGQALLTVPAADKVVRLDLARIPKGAAPACVKLLAGRRLVDAADLP